MNIKDAKRNLTNILKLDHKPVLLWGQPGLGKTAICKQVADDLNWEFVDIRLPLLMPSDLLGLPFPDKEKKRAKWLYPDFFPDPKSKKNILILFDEIGSAPMTVQNGCYRIILDRSIGEHYKFPKGVRMVAASNREIDKSGVGKFNSALANRFIHFFIEADVEAWKDWAWKNNINEKIIAFVKFKENALCKKPKVEEKAYATPRTWEYVSNLLNAKIYDEDVIAGAIGKGTASEFFSYMEVYNNLPEIEDILDGKKMKNPSKLEPSTLFALSSSLAIKANKKNIKNIINYSEKMPKEFNVRTIQDIVRRDESIFLSYSKWKQWLNKYGDIYG